MKVILTGINAKYIHTNLAIRYLSEYAKDKVKSEIHLAEYTINNREEQILDELFRKKPDVLCFSAYIWNIEMIKSLASDFKKISPKTKIILGGPEISFEGEEFLKANPQIDFLILGEGEESFKELILALENGSSLDELRKIKGLCFRSEETGRIIKTQPREPFPMEKLPFPYPDIDSLEGKILYFETQRGCPFRCSYCLSSVSRRVRLMPMDMVKERLKIFLDHKVKQVKLVDRTFNADKNHALEIWKFLKENDNGITNFHFEITANILTDEAIEFLSTVRPELFQLEIGVQSTNEQTLKAISRSPQTKKLLEICKKLDEPKNIHRHLDLIAGLPLEDFASFRKSFNEVFGAKPQQLQLGFLKVLKGSKMYNDANEYGILYKCKPPYEVLKTDCLSYDEVLELKGACEMVESYYNSGRYGYTLSKLLESEPSPFDFFLELGKFYIKSGYHLKANTKEAMHQILKDFFESKYKAYDEELLARSLFDICLHEKPKKLPTFLSSYAQSSREERDKITELFKDRERFMALIPDAEEDDIRLSSRAYHIESFFANGKARYVIFNYLKRDLLGNATFKEISL